MRAIRLCLMVAACLAIWYRPVAGFGPPTDSAPPKVIGDQTEERLFYQDQFVYVPPPTPDITDNPKLYTRRFRVGPPADSVPSSASPTPTATSVPSSAAAALQPPTPTATYAVISAAAVPSTPPPAPQSTAVFGRVYQAEPPTAEVVAPTPVPAQPTATPAPPQAASAGSNGAMTAVATRFVLGGNTDPRFHEGSFRYTAPATPPPIDDPRFYRGSFTINAAGHLAPTPVAAPTQISVSAEAQGGYTVPAQNTKVDAPFTTGVVSYDKLNPSYTAQSPLPVRGRAMYYNPGIMSEVLSYRLQLNQVQACGDCVGYAALLRAGDINRKVWLQWEDGTVEGPFLVIDVAARHHVPSLLARNWVVDVDYRTAIRRGMNRPLPVTVLAAPPAGGGK